MTKPDGSTQQVNSTEKTSTEVSVDYIPGRWKAKVKGFNSKGGDWSDEGTVDFLSLPQVSLTLHDVEPFIEASWGAVQGATEYVVSSNPQLQITKLTDTSRKLTGDWRIN